MNKGLLKYPLGLTTVGTAVRKSGEDHRWPLRDGLVIWLDGADPSSMTLVSDLISQWDDKSGNGNHATQGTSGNRPGYGAGRSRTMNGIVVPDFDRGDGMDTSLSANDSTTTWIAVVQADVVGTGASATQILSTTGGSPFFQFENYLYFYAGAYTQDPDPLIAIDRPLVLGVSWTAPDITMFINRFRYTSTAAATSLSGNYSVGWRGGGQAFDGAIAEVLIYDRPLTASEINVTAIDYLMTKWGIVA